jgi:hypothetical protein
MVDPPPPAAIPVVEAPPPFQLAGTAIEDGRSFAILALTGNRSAVKEVGAVVEGFELVAVQRGLVRLRRGDKEYELRVPWYDRLAAIEHNSIGGPP